MSPVVVLSLVRNCVTTVKGFEVSNNDLVDKYQSLQERMTKVEICKAK